MALSALTAVARPLLIEGAKEGTKALVAVGVIYGAIGVVAGAGYGAYRGGRKVAGKVRSWRAKRQAQAVQASPAPAEAA